MSQRDEALEALNTIEALEVHGHGDVYRPMHIYADEFRKIRAALERQRELERLLSGWFEGWNDGCHPSGDLLDDTEHALGYAPQQGLAAAPEPDK